MVIYDPLDKFYKSVTGAVCAGEKITFRVKGNFDSVVLILKKDGEFDSMRFEMQAQGDLFILEKSFDRGLYFYYFEIGDRCIGLNKNYVGEITDKPVCFQLTVYDKDYSVPAWLYGGVIYQIFPDRFCRSSDNKILPDDKVYHQNWLDTPIFAPNSNGQVLNNDFFGGDILGIISKLPYLKELGVTAIYLNPIFKAYSNHRYDTGDYMTIDPILGDENDFKKLIDKANELNIKIILDGVFNHTGDDSLYFNKYGKYNSLGAYQSKESPYYDWFNFFNYPNGYDSWWGITTLPSVNEASQGFVDFITGKDGVLERYTKLGIGGWRLDVVDELPTEFVRKIRSAVKNTNKDATIIGEVWEDASNKISYGVRREYFQGKELDGVMNYPLKNAIIDYVRNGNSKNLSRVIKEQMDHYPTFVLNNLMNILSTHDTPRLITLLAGEDASSKSKAEMANMFIPEENLYYAKSKVKIASLLQFTLRGVPSVYYGDEIGMQGYVDPLNRRAYPWDNQDRELLNWYRFLGGLRSNYSAFSQGEYKEIYAENGAFVFIRADENSQLLIAVNAGNKSCTLEFSGKLFDLISKVNVENSFTILPLKCVVLIKKN